MPQWRDRANVGPSSELCSLFPLCDLLFRLTFYVMARFRFYRRELTVAEFAGNQCADLSELLALL